VKLDVLSYEGGFIFGGHYRVPLCNWSPLVFLALGNGIIYFSLGRVLQDIAKQKQHSFSAVDYWDVFSYHVIALYLESNYTALQFNIVLKNPLLAYPCFVIAHKNVWFEVLVWFQRSRPSG